MTIHYVRNVVYEKCRRCEIIGSVLETGLNEI